ncbi:MAG: hypothetical protein LBS51_06780 [Oscillospiraceae bacterium]|jgi:hypothetical protein|nr:hypothetical protein [Oscillospiraceae bacterium]
MGKYDYLAYKLQPEQPIDVGGCAYPQAYYRGEASHPGTHYTVGFQYFTKSFVMEETHFHHHTEEYLIFLGSKMPDVFDFDAEITLLMGTDPDKLEKVVITKPTVVRIPPNTWHCPITFDIRKPVFFQAAYESGVWSKVTRGQKLKDGGMFKYDYDYSEKGRGL